MSEVKKGFHLRVSDETLAKWRQQALNGDMTKKLYVDVAIPFDKIACDFGNHLDQSAELLSKRKAAGEDVSDDLKALVEQGSTDVAKFMDAVAQTVASIATNAALLSYSPIMPEMPLMTLEQLMKRAITLSVRTMTAILTGAPIPCDDGTKRPWGVPPETKSTTDQTGHA